MKKITVLICVLLLSVSFVACGGSTSDNGASTSEATTETKEKVYKTGDMISLNDWEITVDKAKVVQSVKSQFLEFTPEEETDQYLEVSMTVKNNGSEKRYFCPPIANEQEDTYAVLIYDGKYEYTPTTLLGYENSLDNSVVNPVSTKNGDLHFSFPKELGDTTDKMVIQIVSAGDKTKISLK